jgi:uncharacterized protein
MARRGLSSDTLSQRDARRIALHAQGFQGQTRDVKPTWAKIARTVDQLNLLQIDSVNVLIRSHYLPLYARLGDYDKAALDKRCFENKHRQFFECWAHEASLVPLDLHPLMRWRMGRARRGDGIYTHMDNFGKEHRLFLKSTLAHITKSGPIRSAEVPGAGKSSGSWWGWSKGKLALETLFDQGLLTTATRQGFERIYDIPERVIAADILALPTPAEADGFRSLIEKSAIALGIATETDLRDYFRLPIAEARTAIAENVEAGVLHPVTIEGWKQKAYLHKKAKLPTSAGTTALLSPFDPLVWNRDRAERLFNFHYRIELYTPEQKRKFGYYVLPMLQGENLVGRFCFKADRATSTLKVNASHHENGVDAALIAEAAHAELLKMANWLGMEKLDIAQRGNWARALTQVL